MLSQVENESNLSLVMLFLFVTGWAGGHVHVFIEIKYDIADFFRQIKKQTIRRAISK